MFQFHINVKAVFFWGGFRKRKNGQKKERSCFMYNLKNRGGYKGTRWDPVPKLQFDINARAGCFLCSKRTQRKTQQKQEEEEAVLC